VAEPDPSAEERAARPRTDKAARKAERARINRLSRLPFLYGFALRGRAQAVLATLLQVAIAVPIALIGARVVTGEWLPDGVAFVALIVAFGLQALARYLNAKAGRT
jgi:hypothetical protein